jgi:hypothetical protein
LEIRNNCPYWNFSNSATEFEFKIQRSKLGQF